MKVILKRDVANVGLKNEVKEVANGYAQNFLIARGLAEVATAGKVKKAEQAAANRAAQTEKEVAAFTAAVEKIGDTPVTVHATANEKDHLFEAVSVETVAAHLRDVLGVAVDAHNVVIESPIKELGDYTVHVAIGTSKVPVQLRVEGK